MTRQKLAEVKPTKVPARIRLRIPGYRSKRSDAELRERVQPKWLKNYR